MISHLSVKLLGKFEHSTTKPSDVQRIKPCKIARVINRRMELLQKEDMQC